MFVVVVEIGRLVVVAGDTLVVVVDLIGLVVVVV